jgi:ribose/xylose/arabinose/galactoside ABC-type transport system permease subunit
MSKKFNLRDFLMTNGFVIVFVVMLLFFTFATDNFFQYDNLLSVAATAAPWIVMATGLCYVIMAGSIDISIGSTLFISIATVNMAMLSLEQNIWEGAPLGFLHYVDLSPSLGIPIEILIGAIFGCITGFLIVVMKINPLLASMGMMFVTRGLVLYLTDARTQNLPQPMMDFGQIPYFREFVIIVGFIIIMIMHTILERTKFGRQVMAIGNSPETAERLGVPVKKVQFATYVIAAVMITIGGILQIFQIGIVHQRLGVDYEFSALAAIVVGGISLFGGDGKIFPGLVLGGLTLVIAENGLTHMGVSPYAYPFVRGGIIFIAMLADAMKTRVLSRVHVMEEPELEEIKEGA